jgi:hypothetical protein
LDEHKEIQGYYNSDGLCVPHCHHSCTCFVYVILEFATKMYTILVFWTIFFLKGCYVTLLGIPISTKNDKKLKIELPNASTSTKTNKQLKQAKEFQTICLYQSFSYHNHYLLQRKISFSNSSTSHGRNPVINHILGFKASSLGSCLNSTHINPRISIIQSSIWSWHPLLDLWQLQLISWYIQ